MMRGRKLRDFFFMAGGAILRGNDDGDRVTEMVKGIDIRGFGLVTFKTSDIPPVMFTCPPLLDNNRGDVLMAVDTGL